MKRKLALFMVLAMIVSLIPMNVFAASKNTALASPSVDKDTYLGGGTVAAPNLRIQENSTAEWGLGTFTFELKLTNGEWAQTSMSMSGSASILDGGTTGTATFTVTPNGDTFATVQTTVTAKSAGASKLYMDIPMYVKATGGEVKVDVIARDASISSSTVVIANAVSGATKASVSSIKTFADSQQLDTLKIDELVIGSVTTGKPHTLSLKLNNGFEWKNNTTTLSASGGWTIAAATYTGTIMPSTDSRELQISVTPTASSTLERGVMYLSGLTIKRNSDAKVGDVVLTVKDVTGTSVAKTFTQEDVVVAKYADYDVTVKALEDPKTIYAGKFDAADLGSNDNKVAKLGIKEEVVNSWLLNRITKIQFNDEVKVMGFKIKKADSVKSGTGSIKYDGNTTNLTSKDTFYATTNTNKSYIEITNAELTAATDKAEVEIEFYVSVKGNYTGDITATVGGTAMSKETKVVLGKAIAPAAITAVSKDVKIGLKNQPVGDIVITEPAKGVWAAKSDASKNIYVEFDHSGITVNEKGTVTVTKGNATLGSIRGSGSKIIIPIKGESTVPAEITIKGATVDVDRTVPEGSFDVLVGGTSVVQNGDSDELNAKFNKFTAVSTPGVRVITPAPGDTKTISKVVFTIGAKEYKVGDTAVTADVAPFINAQGRTMLPLRAFANALNVTNDNIVWNEAERSVVIFKGDATVKVVIGQAQFSKNGVNIPMDTQAVIQDGRTLLPLRAVAQALGANIAWDEATKTVTVQ